MRLENIPTPAYEQIIADLNATGWKQTAGYGGFDAGIDYASTTLKKQGCTLKFEWKLYFEGQVVGPEALLRELKQMYLESGTGENKQ